MSERITIKVSHTRMTIIAHHHHVYWSDRNLLHRYNVYRCGNCCYFCRKFEGHKMSLHSFYAEFFKRNNWGFDDAIQKWLAKFNIIMCMRSPAMLRKRTWTLLKALHVSFSSRRTSSCVKWWEVKFQVRCCSSKKNFWTQKTPFVSSLYFKKCSLTILNDNMCKFNMSLYFLCNRAKIFPCAAEGNQFV